MDKPYQKRLIWIIFVVIFFILLPILFSQALGYKYNWQKHKLEATGILFIKTYPRDVDVILDGKILDNKTPFKQSKIYPVDTI